MRHRNRNNGLGNSTRHRLLSAPLFRSLISRMSSAAGGRKVNSITSPGVTPLTVLSLPKVDQAGRAGVNSLSGRLIRLNLIQGSHRTRPLPAARSASVHSCRSLNRKGQTFQAKFAFHSINSEPFFPLPPENIRPLRRGRTRAPMCRLYSSRTS